MKRKFFLSDISETEEWINGMQARGYRLVKVNKWFPLYYFERSEASPLLVKIDFKTSMSQDQFDDYICLFEDSGWQHITGYRLGGFQYFQQIVPNSSREIFSDEESEKEMIKTFHSYVKCHTILSLSYVLIFSNTLYKGINLLNPLTWFLSGGIWQMPNDLRWKAVLFELPFVLLRMLPFVIYLYLVIYFLILTTKLKTKQKRSRQKP